MKNLMCVLMFGMAFGQTELTTRVYELPISFSNTQIINIDIEELTGYSFSSANLSIFNLINLFGISERAKVTLKSSYIGDDTTTYWNTRYINVYPSGDFELSGTNGIIMLRGDNQIILECGGYNNSECSNSLTGTLLLSVTAEFPQEDVGLNGDLNDDGEINIVDIVIMVNQILELDGNTGNVGQLLNILQG